MSQDSTPRVSRANPERIARRRPRRRSRRARAEERNLNFESADTRVPAAVVGQSPTLLVAAVEDVCWRVAMDACRASRPGRWHRRAYAAWAEQRRVLEQKRERLRSLVEDELLAW
jgi:hypothetical protein